RRGDVHDGARPSRHHAWHDRAAHQHRSNQIAIDERADILQLDVQRVVRIRLAAGFRDVTAGGVDEERDGSEGALDLAGKGGDLRLVADVAGDDARAAAATSN